MDFIFSVITAVVIAVSAGGAGAISGGDEVGAPALVGAAEQDDPVPCLAPCTYDAATDTYSCPC